MSDLGEAVARWRQEVSDLRNATQLSIVVEHLLGMDADLRDQMTLAAADLRVVRDHADEMAEIRRGTATTRVRTIVARIEVGDADGLQEDTAELLREVRQVADGLRAATRRIWDREVRALDLTAKASLVSALAHVPGFRDRARAMREDIARATALAERATGTATDLQDLRRVVKRIDEALAEWRVDDVPWLQEFLERSASNQASLGDLVAHREVLDWLVAHDLVDHFIVRPGERRR